MVEYNPLNDPFFIIGLVIIITGVFLVRISKIAGYSIVVIGTIICGVISLKKQIGQV